MTYAELLTLARNGDGAASQALFEMQFTNPATIKYDADVQLSKDLAAL
jgi:hypothetical protein